MRRIRYYARLGINDDARAIPPCDVREHYPFEIMGKKFERAWQIPQHAFFVCSDNIQTT
jgi:hypothetical protein